VFRKDASGGLQSDDLKLRRRARVMIEMLPRVDVHGGRVTLRGYRLVSPACGGEWPPHGGG